jgi:hypothetical protein
VPIHQRMMIALLDETIAEGHTFGRMRVHRKAR